MRDTPRVNSFTVVHLLRGTQLESVTWRLASASGLSDRRHRRHRRDLGAMVSANKVWAGRLGNLVFALIALYAYYRAGHYAYDIRLYAIKIYGRVIHEFDPWFNYRATVYLADNGWYAFSRWFDYTAWYPLGRPVGTTIYPGMQVTSVAIWNALNAIGGDWAMSLNDVCCFVPAWFGVSASMFLGMLTAECSQSHTTGAAAALIMAIVPAHIMRSVGGGYDNESIALTAMCATFYCWVRALRTEAAVKDGAATRGSVVFGMLTGLCYFYMVAAWGGFVFVLNMIGLHAAVLVAAGRFTSKLHRAYSLFYVIGTLGAIQVPVVGWGPLKSLEQLGPLAIFIGMQVLEVAAVRRRKYGLSLTKTLVVLIQATLPVAVVVLAVVVALNQQGYFGPFSSRVRGLFVKHTRTGNPLVDSVAEHQPANEQAYQHYLHHVYSVVPFGLVLSVLTQSDSNSFLVLYALVGYYFANKMARLVILLGPIASALGGVAIGTVADQLLVNPVAKLLMSPFASGDEAPAAAAPAPAAAAPAAAASADKELKSKELKAAKAAKAAEEKEGESKGALGAASGYALGVASTVYNHPLALLLRLGLGLWVVRQSLPKAKEFYDYSHQLAEGFSQPSIMFKARLNTGEEIIVDDYREAYWWLRDHTPKDARVMAWWDYGYQINGIAERTSIADGNTWNHEHIATLGRILTSGEEEAHGYARHLADYVLVWAGGGGDDLAKSPHMARIGNSVYHDICPGDPTCSSFGFYQGGVPTPMMEKCLLYRMVNYGQPNVKRLNSSRYTHAFTSKYGKVMIFKVRSVSKKSKDWVADPANKVCDAPGSWYCTGQYPPAIQWLIDKRKPFKQLEDFNTQTSEEDKQYQKEYHRRMAGRGRADADEGGGKGEPGPEPAASYVGCYGAEKAFGAARKYTGGPLGTSVEMARSFAVQEGKKYFAIAQVGVDGHVFAFDDAPNGKDLSDMGCAEPCADDERLACGCADDACGDLRPVKGEEHVRRWVVYKVEEDAGDSEMRKKSKKKRA